MVPKNSIYKPFQCDWLNCTYVKCPAPSVLEGWCEVGLNFGAGSEMGSFYIMVNASKIHLSGLDPHTPFRPK